MNTSKFLGFIQLSAVLAGGSFSEAAQTNYENYTFYTLIGQRESASSYDGTSGVSRFNYPMGVARDTNGTLYVADTVNHAIRKISPAGIATTIAGLAGTAGTADGIGAVARFNNPAGVTVDANGTLFIADTFNHTIRKITPDGNVTTVAGLAGIAGGTDGVGSAARFNKPYGLTVDGSGNLYVADTYDQTIRKITPAGAVSTLAGSPSNVGSTNATGTAARFNYPGGIVLDPAGNLFVTDLNNNEVRRITPGNVVTTFAGSLNSGSTNGTGSAAQFNQPFGLGMDKDGNLYVADSGNFTLRKITADGTTTTIAGSVRNSGGSDGTNSVANFNQTSGIAVSPDGTVFMADSGNNSIRQVTPAGVVTTVGGQGSFPAAADGTGSAARFAFPSGVAVDAAGTIYVADFVNHIVRKSTPDGVVTTLAGVPDNSGTNDGPVATARFNHPVGVAVDSLSGDIYVADNANHTIRKISGGQVITLAGQPTVSGTNDGVGIAASFNSPIAVALDVSNNVYVADADNNAIRKITPDGTVTTLAGLPGAPAGSQDGIGTAARFNTPEGIAVDGSGTVYVADDVNATIRKIAPNGTVTTVAGSAGVTGSTDGTGTEARFNAPFGVALDRAGSLYIAEQGNQTIRKMTPAGVVTTLAGTPGARGSTDGTGAAARFNAPEGLAVDGDGNVYVPDGNNHSIRKGFPALPDVPVVDRPFGAPGVPRQLAVSNLTTASWTWSFARYPSTSSAQLSSTIAENPTLTPDVADLYMVRFEGRDSQGRHAFGTVPVGIDVLSTASLAVHVHGAGSVSPDYSNQALELGGTYTIVAIPDDGFRFLNWTGSVTNTSASLTFNLQSNLNFTANFVSTNDSTTHPIVLISGKGTVSPNYSGKTLISGKSYTMTARPAAGYIFTNWTGSIPSSSAKMVFTMGPYLLFHANFVPNPFPSLKGTYTGLFAPTDGKTHATSGLLTANITTLGAFSAKILLAGSTYSLSGQFSASGSFSNSVARRGQSPLSVKLQLDMAGKLNLNGTISSDAWSSTLTANRVVFSAGTPAFQTWQNYSLVIPGGANAASQPAGFGSAFVKISSIGQVSVSGTLADGNKITQSTFLSANYNWPLYVSLYSGKGSIQGAVSLVNQSDRDLDGLLSWTKLAGASGKIYQAGFVLTTNAFGSIYSPVSAVPIINWPNGGNLILAPDGDLPAGITNAITIDSHFKVTGPAKTIVKIALPSGMIQGSVLNPATSKSISFNGILVQKQNKGYGAFLGTQSGKVLLLPR